MPQVVPKVYHIPPQHPHPLRLAPVALLVPDERRFVDALGQDEDAQRRQRDASIPEGAEEPADDVGSWAGGHSHKPNVLKTDVLYLVEDFLLLNKQEHFLMLGIKVQEIQLTILLVL